MNNLKSYFLMLYFCFTGTYSAFAQNYFYTNIKVPFLEYLAYTASQSNNDPNNTTAGLFFNAG
jgi:hypothetical protein